MRRQKHGGGEEGGAKGGGKAGGKRGKDRHGYAADDDFIVGSSEEDEEDEEGMDSEAEDSSGGEERVEGPGLRGGGATGEAPEEEWAKLAGTVEDKLLEARGGVLGSSEGRH